MTAGSEQPVAHADAFAGHLQPGERPALLLVDMVEAYLQETSPLYLETAQAALVQAVRLLARARQSGTPVVFTNVAYKADGSDGGHFFRKVPALSAFVEGSPLGAFPQAITPQDGEPVFTKQYPSAFFGTALDRHLHDLGVDTVIVAGYSTSGCVRASALDALQYGFIPIIAEDACADRDSATHDANLSDLGKKYAEIQSVDTILDWLPQPGP
ncbi:isochorismatase family protein [Qipengyuania sp. DSG2-2]|uniref:isochorismatase family protein n=1 Tax=Qipengyuania sp. DGS2-2 TaxID=3349631 RepID=UPI0036D418D7